MSGTTLMGEQPMSATAADHVVLSQSGGIVVDQVNGALLDSAGSPINVSAASVTRIEIRTRGGDDIVDFSQLTASDFPALGSTNIDGGRGNDTLTGSWLPDGIGGDWGNDTIVGGAGNDFIRAGLGHDHIRGMDGNDTIGGEQGDDTIYGGNGNDAIQGDVGNDRIFGDAGNDSLRGGFNNDFICGGSGNDDIEGFWGRDTLLGGSGNDKLTGGLGRDIISGGSGADRVYAKRQGKDTIYKDSSDTIDASRNDDERWGSYGSCTDSDTTQPPPPPKCPADFGDAPDTYGTLKASGGAEHEFQSTAPRMGNLVDTETDGQPTLSAIGDNMVGPATFNDEDGVSFVGGTMHHPNTTKTVIIDVQNLPTGTAFVDAWIDFNKNGIFDTGPGSNEQILTSRPVAAGLNALLYNVPPSVMVGPAITYARFRISSAGGLSPKGFVAGGEVEDYTVQVDCDHGDDPNDPRKGGVSHSGKPGDPVIADPVSTGGVISDPGKGNTGNPGTGNPTSHACELDFGDAPNSYKTLLASNGPRHEIHSTGPRLGTFIDGDTDGQPSLADADDNTVFDDEDGITFVGGPMHYANTVKTVIVDVQNMNSFGSAKIDAWIDFNKDGDFDDPSEKLVFSTNTVTLGLNTLTYTVPAAVMTGPAPTYARFRLSTAGGLASTGLAADGEVEDYQVLVDCLHETPIPVVTKDDPQKLDTAQDDPKLFADSRENDAESILDNANLDGQSHEDCITIMEEFSEDESDEERLVSEDEQLSLIGETERELAADSVFAEVGFAV